MSVYLELSYSQSVLKVHFSVANKQVPPNPPHLKNAEILEWGEGWVWFLSWQGLEGSN